MLTPICAMTVEDYVSAMISYVFQSFATEFQILTKQQEFLKFRAKKKV